MAASSPRDDDRPIPKGQAFMDNTFLLLFLGLAVPILFYTVWGLVELLSLPSWPAK